MNPLLSFKTKRVLYIMSKRKEELPDVLFVANLIDGFPAIVQDEYATEYVRKDLVLTMKEEK